MEEENEGYIIDFGDECDLHHFHPKDRDAVVEEFINQAAAKRLRRIRIVHGKGKSAAKERIITLLRNDPRVSAFGDDGPNWGATIVIMKVAGSNERQ